MGKNKGKVISGVYVSDSGGTAVMTLKQFIRKKQLKGNGRNGGAKPIHWSKYHAPSVHPGQRKTKAQKVADRLA